MMEHVAEATLEEFTAIEADRLTRAAAAAVRKCLRANPISARAEKLLRAIATKFYGDRRCYARQETIAKHLGCSKATVQADLAELEARGLIRITKRDGTSNLITLADGVTEALAQVKRERESARINWPRAARLKASFDNQIPVVFSASRPKRAKLSQTLSATQNRVEDANASQDIHTPSVVFSENSQHTFARGREADMPAVWAREPSGTVPADQPEIHQPRAGACAREAVKTETEVVQAVRDVVDKIKNQETTEQPEPVLSRSLPRPLLQNNENTDALAHEKSSNDEHETSISHALGNGLKREEMLAVSDVSPHYERDTISNAKAETPVITGTNPRVETAKEALETILIAEGVSPSQARVLVRDHDSARITRNLALLDAANAKNPGAWLRSAIVNDWAKGATASKPVRPHGIAPTPKGFGCSPEQRRAIEARERAEIEAEYDRRHAAKAAVSPEALKPVTSGTYDAPKPENAKMLAGVLADLTAAFSAPKSAPKRVIGSGLVSMQNLVPAAVVSAKPIEKGTEKAVNAIPIAPPVNPVMARYDALPEPEKAELRERALTVLAKMEPNLAEDARRPNPQAKTEGKLLHIALGFVRQRGEKLPPPEDFAQRRNALVNPFRAGATSGP